MISIVLDIPGVTITAVISTPGLCHSKIEGSVCDDGSAGNLVLLCTSIESNNGTLWLTVWL